MPAEVREGRTGTAEAERHQALREWNDTGRPFRADACVHELFAEQAARTPDAVAVVDGRRTLTYADLDRSADRLALRLRGLGVGPDVRAAVAAERSAEMVVALLAVLKAGGAYVPLDPAYPTARLASMLHDSGAAVLLAQRGVLPGLPPFAGPAVVLEEEGAADPPLLPSPAVSVLPENLAYVIYTSGSTGRPKGVLLTHRGLVNLVAAQVRLFAIGADSAVLQFASFSFDASVSEIFTALLSGARLHLAERADLIPGPDLERTVRERGITVATLAPTALAALDDPDRLPSLRTVVSAGEACPAPLAARWSRGRRFLNAYGPTEVTVCATAQVVAETVSGDPPPGGVPIGRPIDNIRVAVLGPGGNPVGEGESGEIALSGIGLARGYLGRPDLTAERFIPALAGEPGERAYRTGDLGRWLPDGRLEFLGRIDQQIKIRGHRIEPGEIEAAMASLPGVAEAVVVARDEPGGDRRLAAFFVPAGLETQPAELRRQLARQLPEHMVPAVFIPLSSFPLTPNGKVDRAALARRPLPQEPAAGGGEAPRGPLEELIAAVWADVLGLHGAVGAHDRFFDLGGHSLLATQVLSRLRQAFGAELTMRDFFAAPTVAGLAARIARSGGASRVDRIELPPVAPVPHDRPLPLSFAQRRLWLLENLEPGSPLYNLPQALALRGPLQAGALAAALREIVRRHEVLRTRFAEVENLPVQVVLPPPAAALPLADLAALPPAKRAMEADRLTLEEARRPFDLTAPPMLRMLRALLLRLGDGEHRLLLTVHHIASDGWSQGILTAELAALYGAFAAGRPSPLPELPVQYGDFAAWQERWLTESALAPHLAYWRQHLEGAPTLLELPADRPRPAVRTVEGALLRGGGADGALARGVRDLARRQGATPFMVLLAAFQTVLHRLSGAEHLLVGTPIANRNRAETEKLIGFFVNTLVMRADLDGGPAFLDLLARTREATLEAHAHQDLPFEKLVEELRPERDLSHTPLFQVMLVLESLPAPPDLAGLSVAALPVDNRTSKFDLTLIAADRPDGLELDLEYSTDLFDAPAMGRLLGWLRTLLAGAVADPAARLSDLPLLGAAERFQVLTEWNDTADLPEPLACLGELFAAQAARTPEAEALVAPGERLTYRELDRRAARLAGHLRALGVGPEVLCGVLLDRSPDLVVALLAVHKAGGAYVPLDPAYPSPRIALMLETSRAAAVITRRERLAGLDLPEWTRPVLLEAGWEEAKERGSGPIGPIGRIGRIDPDNLAYLIFTSGSTGVPKGVALTHRNASAFLAWAWGVFPPEDLAGVLAATSVCFDLSVFELFATLGRGGKVILAENALALAQHPAAGEVTLINTVPSAMAELLKSGAVPSSVRTVNLAGEPLKNALAQEIYARTAVRRVLDLYGPSEDTTYSTFAPVERGSGRAPAIGRPIAGTRAYLLDAGLHPVPLGIPGALYLAGAGLARGYLGRPDLTAERFIPDPFAVRPGERLYQTGDLARFRPDGQLDFLGRIDQQVKVRGFRIEPGEIEAALARHPEVREAAVLALADVGGEGKRLVAFVAAHGSSPEAAPAPASLRAFLQEQLPHYMVPSLFLALPALPLTPNGKIDRKALARLGEGSRRTASEEGFVAPRTPLEETLAAVWAGVFKRPRIGVHDNFFDLGGHSLLAAQVVSRLRAALGIDIPLRRLFEAPTIERLARSLEPALAAKGAEPGGAAPLAPLPAEPGGAGTPLSFAQRRLWFLEWMTPGSAAYNLPYPLLLAGDLDAPALAHALSEIVRRHEALRTTFSEGPDGPVQVIASPAPVDLPPLLPEIDLTGLAEERRGAVLAELVRAESSRPFDLAAGPLLRTVLARTAPREHALLLTVHHIVADGWSLGVWVDELTALYAAFVAGEPSPLPELPAQYSDFARWQRQRLRGDEMARLLEYWRRELAGAPTVLELPADRPRPAVPTFRGSRRGRALPPGLAAAVRDLGRCEGATLFMVALAAFAALLFRLTRQEDLLVGAPVANRGRADFEGLIGFFVNTLVLRADLAGDPSFRELLGRVRETALAAYAHEDLPFDTLVEELRPERDRSHQPLCQVALVVENGRPEPAVDGLRLAPLPVDTGTAKFDLTLTVSESGAGLSAGIEVASDLFTAVTAERILDQFSRLLAAAVENPGQRLLDLPLLSAAERHQAMVEWNDARGAYPREALVHDLVAEQAARTPGAVAVEQGERRMTYRELDERAEGLAARLRELGVGPDVPVALLMERAPETIVALLAVLKAGGAYAPLDPGHPRERLALVLADLGDLGAPVVLVHGHLVDRLPEGTAARVIRIEKAPHPPAPSPIPSPQPGEGENNRDLCLEREVAPLSRRTGGDGRGDGGEGHLAYVLYTSGTTGRPKGVAVPHRAVVRLVKGINYARLGPGEVLLQAGPIAFDASTFEIWGALANGGRLVLYPGERPSPDELGAVIARHGVTTLWLTAGLFQQVADDPLGGFGSVRQLLAGGDVLSARHVRTVLAALPGCTVINGYGPTEGTTFTCFHPMTDPAEVREPVPLGRPVANSAAYLLDAALRPVPVGVPGELYAGGDGLARGYLGRPDLTAERFVPAPLGDEPGGRLYATGDLARWLPDGRIEFLGRIDQQVKIRGFRIEPAEIEAVLGKHPEVAEAAVLVRQEMDGDKRLVACVVPRSIPAPLPAALRAFLKERLPEAMIPAAFLAVDALPLTASGKVDRRALDALAAASLEGGEGLAAAAYVAPRTPEEEILVNVWAELLRLPRVGVHDNFFALGGHSLLATLLISRVRDAFGVELPVRYLFEAPTVAGLAAVIAATKPHQVGEALELLREPIRPAPRPASDGPLPVSFAQQRLWFLDRLTPGSAAYNIPWPLRITGPLVPGALGAALQALIERHEALRTTFMEHEGEPGQLIHPPEPPELPLVDLSRLPALTRDSEAHRWILAESLRPFDLAAGPLLRATLLRLEASEHVLLLVLHHIVADGWSMEVLTRELLALSQGEPLPPLPIQYADFAWWQRHKLAGEGLAGQLAFWRERLAGAPAALALPTDRPRPPVQSTRGASCPIDLPPDCAAALRAACRREGVTLFMLLLAAFDALLARTTGDEDLLVGTPIANRNRGEIEGLIGFFANTLALRTDLTGDPSFRALLRQVRETALAAYAHQDLPFEALVEELHPERDLSRSPLFQVMLSLDSRRPAVASGALEVRALPLDSTTAKFDLSLSLSDDGAALDGGLEYNRDLFDRTTMARLLRRFVLLLEAAAVSPGLRLSALPVLAPAERHQVLIEWSAEGTDARLLDAWRQPAPIGVIGEVGEVDAGGPQRGDLSRWLPEGRLERLGSGHWLSELLGTRRALAEHRAARALTSARRPPQAYVAPRTPAESAVARIWQEVLEVDRVGVMDDFFDLGGHSLLVMRVLSRIRSVLHVDLPAQTLFEAPTVAALAERVERAGAARRLAGGTPPIEPAAREAWNGRLPLSFGQRRLWFFEALDPGSSVLNVPAPLRLTGRLSPAALAAALAETVRRHEALRTVFPTWEGQPYQDVRPAGPAALPLLDLAGLPAAARDAEAARLAADDARRPFDLAHGPLLRTALVRLTAADHLLLAAFHHIVTDGWSNEVFTREFLALHEAFAAGRPSPLPALPVQYPDFAVWQQRWLTGGTVESLLATWKRHFGDSLPVLRLPTDRPRPAELTFAGDYRSRRLPAPLAERVRALGPAHGATLFMTLLAAFQALLRAYAGQDTVVVGTPVAGRGRTELEGMIGFFVNTLVLRGDLDGDPTFQELLERTRDRVLGAFACQDLPFEKLVDALQPERDRSRSPLFQVMFALQSAQPAPPTRPLAAAPYGGGTGTAQFDLTLYMADLPEGLTAGVEFNTDLFDAATAERLLGHYQDLLERVTANPQIRLPELSVPPLVERAAAPPAPETAQPAAGSIDSRRARLLERRGQLSAEQQRLLAERLRGQSGPAAPSPPQSAKCLVEITPAAPNSRPPFFCVHPAGGDVLCFFPLARQLGPEQPFYGLQARGLEDERDPLSTIEEMAAVYIEELRRVQPAGPYRLGGWSFGGLAAFEMARQLRAAGQDVALLAVIDTGPGVPEWMPLDPSFVDETDPSRQLLVAAEYLKGLRGVDLGLHLEDLSGHSAGEQIRLFVDRLQRTGVMHAEDSLGQVRRLLRVYRTNVHAYRAYRPRPYPGPVTVLRAASEAAPADAPADLGWSAFTPLPATVREVPGDHVTLLAEPNVRVLAETLRSCLRENEP